MQTATVIIGAGFGDEGKGLATDYFAGQSPEQPIVIRFNGGAQAGHTVQAPTGEHHVFSHFSSASLQGAVTGLSRFFVCHPILFHSERDRLAALGVRPRVIVDPLAPITTPYEVMINQALELNRGGNRHGSCGVGFGETIEREENSPHRLRAGDLADPVKFAARLRSIRDDYVPARLAALGLPTNLDHLADDAILARFVEDAMAFADCVEIADIATASANRPVIYEGAQGLGLDMDRGDFPHVTRSNTGLKNVVALAREAGIGKLEICYVTRAYLSRHGAGPLENELSAKPYAGIVDTTNVNNDWQGQLRLAWLDVDTLRDAIHADLGDAVSLETSTQLMVTCLDQVDPMVTVVARGKTRSISREALPGYLAAKIGASGMLASYGPCRNQVRSEPVSTHQQYPSWQAKQVYAY